ncbi:Sensor histidine kinase regulating citrate/malate metabolism [Promicromonospora umidemergens]|uniref:histidine kinase n=1 Tax=Promicromonospora umidemergens TaxID=629679 RepID=A0ABP8X7H8_9MICO|nr:ATP-binding protein [Promicromonospora umidemergens]MCP2281487.1 Sensor histidine kinase regulating citrate/malate metabolism [Promicromonospora umidemergens]
MRSRGHPVRRPTRRPTRQLTLGGQVLALQLAVLLVVVAAAAVVFLGQADAAFRDDRADRLEVAAEGLAGIPAVQATLTEEAPDTRALAFYLQSRAAYVDARNAYLTDLDGRILAATDPTRTGERLDLPDAAATRAGSGDVADVAGRSIAAWVPVYGGSDPVPEPSAPQPVAVVVLADPYPPLTERLSSAGGDVLVVLGIGTALAAAGSWLLARLVKRRTRGLEPAQIAALADHREGVLRSIREGVVVVGDDGRVSLVSDSANELLGLPADAPDPSGRRLEDLGLDPAVLDLLRGTDEVHDAVLVAGDTVLVINRRRVLHDGRPAGTVTTLRDRTELLALQSELHARESVTETLRAQTHEFSNQLHTVSGLIELGEYDEVGRFVDRLTRRRADLSDAVTARVADPAVAALLIAKATLADERHVELVVDPGSALPRLDPDLSADVGTVLGNLVDNAVDAAASSAGSAAGSAAGSPAGPDVGGGVRPARVRVRLVVSGPREDVVVEVADSGPGVAPGQVDAIFRRGWSTKPAGTAGRGVGLALVHVLTQRRGGGVTVRDDDSLGGAAFTAQLPQGIVTGEGVRPQ